MSSKTKTQRKPKADLHSRARERTRARHLKAAMELSRSELHISTVKDGDYRHTRVTVKDGGHEIVDAGVKIRFDVDRNISKLIDEAFRFLAPKLMGLAQGGVILVTDAPAPTSESK